MTTDSPERSPLSGIRVLDLSAVFAAPYMGALLGDLGADVIKIEPPARLDQTRGGGFGPYLDNDPGDDGWNWSGTFHNLNRGKRSLVLDLKQEQGREVLAELVRSADVLLENFTPRVMRGWGMIYEQLSRINPRLVMLSNTGYGSTGPWSAYKAQGTTLEATMGLTNFSGYEGDKPRKVGQSYPDFLAAWTGLTAILTALVDRETTGVGRWIDLGMYELGAAVIPEALIAAQAGTVEPTRTGNRDPQAQTSGVYATKSAEQFIAITLVNQAMLQRAHQVIPGLPTAIDDEGSRKIAEDALAHWAATQDSESGAALLQDHGIAAASVADVRGLLLDPQYQHRSFFEWVSVRDQVRPLVGRPYRWTGGHTVGIRSCGPRFGEHNVSVLRDAGISPERIAELAGNGVVAERPAAARLRPTDFPTLVAAGVYREVDDDFREVLDRALCAVRMNENDE